jgi:hypothetical protein
MPMNLLVLKQHFCVLGDIKIKTGHTPTLGNSILNIMICTTGVKKNFS